MSHGSDPSRRLLLNVVVGDVSSACGYSPVAFVGAARGEAAALRALRSPPLWVRKVLRPGHLIAASQDDARGRVVAFGKVLKNARTTGPRVAVVNSRGILVEGQKASERRLGLPKIAGYGHWTPDFFSTMKLRPYDWVRCWNTSDQYDWMVYAASRAGVTDARLTEVACAMARTTLPMIPADDRPASVKRANKDPLADRAYVARALELAVEIAAGRAGSRADLATMRSELNGASGDADTTSDVIEDQNSDAWFAAKAHATALSACWSALKSATPTQQQSAAQAANEATQTVVLAHRYAAHYELHSTAPIAALVREHFTLPEILLGVLTHDSPPEF